MSERDDADAGKDADMDTDAGTDTGAEADTDTDADMDADTDAGAEDTPSPPTPTSIGDLAPFFGMGALFVAVPLLALALVPTFDEAGLQATPDAEDPTYSIVYFVAILVFTVFVLYVVKRGAERVLQAFILVAVAVLTFYTLVAVVGILAPPTAAFAVAGIGAVAVAAAVGLYPEWYVINTAGVLMGAAGAGIFGISFGILPALVLLVVLAVYDAIAVYRTKHMLTLADGVMDLKLPVMFVVPRRLDYSFTASDEDLAEEGGHDALFMGLGDAVIPGVLIVSAAQFIDAPLAGNYAVFGAFAGAVIGYFLLMRKVAKGEPHAGLPLLNGGTIAGFFVGAYLLGITPLEAVGL